MSKLIAAQSVQDVFGKIEAPSPIQPLTKDGGAAGISMFLSNVVTLIYITASIVFVFMVLISAFQWITSAGDKEKVAAARNRLTFAIIGIVILALAFVIIRLVGQVTGFEFFVGQNNIGPRYQTQNCNQITDPGCN